MCSHQCPTCTSHSHKCCACTRALHTHPIAQATRSQQDPAHASCLHEHHTHTGAPHSTLLTTDALTSLPCMHALLAQTPCSRRHPARILLAPALCSYPRPTRNSHLHKRHAHHTPPQCPAITLASDLCRCSGPQECRLHCPALRQGAQPRVGRGGEHPIAVCACACVCRHVHASVPGTRTPLVAAG